MSLWRRGVSKRSPAQMAGEEEQALAATEAACRVYVGNLLPKAKESHLTSKFARFGTIHSVWIARRPPGFAFVRFATPDAAQRAVEACREDGAMEILGKAVRVQMAGDKDRKHSARRRGAVVTGGGREEAAAPDAVAGLAPQADEFDTEAGAAQKVTGIDGVRAGRAIGAGGAAMEEGIAVGDVERGRARGRSGEAEAPAGPGRDDGMQVAVEVAVEAAA
ncbi:hypothetical protein ON010_g19033 [Phytophthora cinnamomi]|nr:hypothetical protein ON010_g19033 [Phytophthora cinnamomi]